jgi:tRNA threonylcarbamoyladenosine biosynthesis protein TsaE
MAVRGRGNKRQPLARGAKRGYAPHMWRSELVLPQPEDTTAFAQRLAPLLRAGDVVLLKGEIGAGKTHFARALIQSLLPEPEDVPSPTYTLVQVYLGPGFEIWHADLYRLSGPAEVRELGLEDAFETALCLIEWPERLGALVPESALLVTFSPYGEGRKALIEGPAPWAERLA